MSETRLGVMFLDPTAVQAWAEVHDTAARLKPCAPAGTGMCYKAHFPPFHRCP